VHRIIITGGSGFIGRHLVKRLLSCKGNSVVLISNTSYINDKYLEHRKFPQDMSLKFYAADIRDKKAISDIFGDERADTCIHLAAKTSVSDSVKNPNETLDFWILVPYSLQA
jgi:UDP-glucose 4-epimerase